MKIGDKIQKKKKIFKVWRKRQRSFHQILVNKYFESQISKIETPKHNKNENVVIESNLNF